MKATKLQFSTREINKNFKMKVYGYTDDGHKVDMLVGVSGLIRLIGEELANKQITRAFNSGDDKCICRLRRGLKVIYYAH